MIAASVGLDSSLLLEPSSELLFPHPTSLQHSRCILTLTNLSSVHGVVFRVRTRDPNAFAVRPTHGLVLPGTSCQVTIIATKETCARLQANDLCDFSICESSEIFLVQSLEVGDKVRHLTHLDLKAPTLPRTIWNQVPKEVIAEKKMFCRFMYANPEVTQDEKMSSRSMDSTNTFSKTFLCSHDEQSILRSKAQPSFGRSSSLNFSLSNYHTSFEERRHGRESVDSHANISKSMELRVSASMSNATSMDSSVGDGRVEAEMSSSSRRDTGPTGPGDNVMAITDTMISALSTDTTPCECTQELSSPLYRIQPSDVLSFDVKPAPHCWGSTSFFIVNASQNDCLIFKVRTSNQLGYVVKPSRGVVSTTNAQKVVVFLCAPRNDAMFDPAERQAKDGFMIEVANISRDKGGDLLKMNEQRRSSETNSLWSLVPQDKRQSSILSVKFKSEYGDGKVSEVGKCVTSSRSSKAKKKEEVRRHSFHPNVRHVKQVPTSSSTDEAHDGEEKSTRKCALSELDMSAFTNTHTTDMKSKVGKENVAETLARKGSSVVVISADMMDTVDFSSPQLSFYI